MNEISDRPIPTAMSRLVGEVVANNIREGLIVAGLFHSVETRVNAFDFWIEIRVTLDHTWDSTIRFDVTQSKPSVLADVEDFVHRTTRKVIDERLKQWKRLEL